MAMVSSDLNIDDAPDEVITQELADDGETDQVPTIGILSHPL
jgi:hypothetical protein